MRAAVALISPISAPPSAIVRRLRPCLEQRIVELDLHEHAFEWAAGHAISTLLPVSSCAAHTGWGYRQGRRDIVLPHTPIGGGNKIRRAMSQAYFRRLFPAAIHLLGEYPLFDIYRLSLFQDSCTSSGAVPSLKDFRHLLIALVSWTLLDRVSVVAFLINRFRHGFFWAIFLISSSAFTFGFAIR